MANTSFIIRTAACVALFLFLFSPIMLQAQNVDTAFKGNLKLIDASLIKKKEQQNDTGFNNLMSGLKTKAKQQLNNLNPFMHSADSSLIRDSATENIHFSSKKDSLAITSNSFIGDKVTSIKVFHFTDTISLQRLKPITTVISSQLKIQGSFLIAPGANEKPAQHIFNNKFNNFFTSLPLLQLRGGFVSYNTDYRSNIDTPFREKNIWQHNVYGSMSVSVKSIPFKITYLFRRSNVAIFKNINDVQVEFDALQFGGNLRNKLREKLLALSGGFVDSLSCEQLKLKKHSISDLNDWFNSPVVRQKIVEYSQVLSIPEITYDPNIGDSTNLAKSAAVKKEAVAFIDDFNKRKLEAALIRKHIDSLQIIYDKSVQKIKDLKQLINEKMTGSNSLNDIEKSLKKAGIKQLEIPEQYRLLMNTRKFGLGRNQLNYSELTSRNMSLTGLNFEYASWYYFAVAAGNVDYRFRDFITGNQKRQPQHMLLTRLGIGAPEKTHLIISFYKGNKQLFAVTDNYSRLSSINITGIAAEIKYRLNHNTYLLAEAASSISPDFRKNPVITEKFALNDKSNKAMSFKVYTYLPKTASKFEAMYKYKGINFQSFSSFQPNAELKSWYVKADQQFFRRKLKISGSLISNEYANPFVSQNYKANSVFKSLQISYRSRNFPSITIGYIPTSQINSIDSQLIENKFYSFNAGASHSYKIGIRKAYTSITYSRFFNHQTDSALLFYNAANIFFSQTIVFSFFTMNVNFSHSDNNSFVLNVMEGGLAFPVLGKSEFGFGVKVNNFNRQINDTGGFANIRLNIKHLGVLSIQYDNGFMPGSYQKFIRNEMMNVNFSRFF